MIPFVDKLLSRLPADHPGRERIAEAGRLLMESLAEIGRKVASADADARRTTARRLRQILDFVATDRPLERIAQTYAELRAVNFHRTPWGQLNAVLIEAYGEDTFLDLKERSLSYLPKVRGRVESPPSVASVNRRRVRRKSLRG